MTDSAPASADRIAVAGVAFAVVLVAVQSAVYAIDVWLGGSPHSVLDVNRNGSVFDWASTIAILAAAIALVVLARRGAGRGAVAAAIGTAALAVDDLFQLHERIEHWQLLYVPLLAPVFVLLWRLGQAARRLPGRVVQLGLVVLAFSIATGVVGERILVAGDWGSGEWPYELKVLVKQGAELGGWILVAAGLASSARDGRGRLST